MSLRLRIALSFSLFAAVTLPANSAELPSCLEDQIAARAWVEVPVEGLYEAIPGKTKIKLGQFELTTIESHFEGNTYHRYTTKVAWTDGSKTQGLFLNEPAFTQSSAELTEKLAKLEGPYSKLNDYEFAVQANEILKTKQHPEIADDPQLDSIVARIIRIPWESSVVPTLKTLSFDELTRRWDLYRQMNTYPLLRIDPDYLPLLQAALLRLIPKFPDFFKNKLLFESRTVDKIGTSNFSRTINTKTHKIQFEGATLSREPNIATVPSWIRAPDVPELIPGKGIPTQLYATLNQMKLCGIEKGSLKSAEINTVGNIETSLEIIKFPEIQSWLGSHPKAVSIPGELIASIFLKTPTGRYVSTVLTQSGHRVKSVSMKDADLMTMHQLLTEVTSVSPEARLAVESTPGTTRVPGYLKEVTLELEPIQSR